MTFTDVAKVASDMNICVRFLASRKFWQTDRFLEKSFNNFILIDYTGGYLTGLTIDDYIADDWYLINESDRAQIAKKYNGNRL